MFRMILILSLAYSLPALAQRRQGGGPGGPGGMGGGPNPACQKIREACEKAGYKGRGGPGGGSVPAPTSPAAAATQSPGSIRDCMTKWQGGGTIAGLTIKPTDATGKSCMEHMKKMKERGGPGGMGGGRRGGPGMGGRPGGRPGGPGGPGIGTSRPMMANPSPLAPTPPNPNTKAPAVLPPVPATPPPPAKK